MPIIAALIVRGIQCEETSACGSADTLSALPAEYALMAQLMFGVAGWPQMAILACSVGIHPRRRRSSAGSAAGHGFGPDPCQINYATVINDLLGHRTLRLPTAEEVEHPLGQECGGVRVVRRQ
jgi:hypothetical protein